MERALTSDGVPVAFYDLGGDGPPLLLAHATGFHGHIWLPISHVLREHFHCYAFDERGHGDTPPPADGDFDWHGFGRDVLAVVDAAHLERPFGVGHSCGAAALFLAEQDRPGTFRAIYGFEPVVVPRDEPLPPNGQNPLAIGARRRREVFPDRETAYENYASKPPFSRLAPAALRAYVDHGFDDLPDGTVRLKCRGENEAKVYERGYSHGAFARLGEVRCPVTVACGEQTDAFGPPVIQAHADRLPYARTDVVPGLTHFGPLEDPEEIADRILRFFSGV